MAITAKGIIDSAVGIGRSAVSAGTGLIGRLRGGEHAESAPPTGPPATAKTGQATPTATATAQAKASGAKTTPKRTSGSPDTVGAPKPGEAGGHKSATAGTDDKS
jgi:hypothetical protein